MIISFCCCFFFLGHYFDLWQRIAYIPEVIEDLGCLRATESGRVETSRAGDVEKVLATGSLPKELWPTPQKALSSRSLRFAKLQQIATSTAATAPMGSSRPRPHDSSRSQRSPACHDRATPVGDAGGKVRGGYATAARKYNRGKGGENGGSTCTSGQESDRGQFLGDLGDEQHEVRGGKG